MGRRRSHLDDPVDPVYSANCYLCSRDFHFGNGRYYGRWISKWEISICQTCLNGNWDGIVLAGPHSKLRKHLEQKGIEITLNENGWLPIPS
jgi:hypothetical protein